MIGSVQQLVELYDSEGDRDYIGEPVSQRDHALQAASLACAASAPSEAVLAALLHDVGHLSRVVAEVFGWLIVMK